MIQIENISKVFRTSEVETVAFYYIASGKQEQTSQKGIHILSFHNLLRLCIENFQQRYSFQTYGQCSFFPIQSYRTILQKYCLIIRRVLSNY